MGSLLPWTSSLLFRTNPSASELIPTIPSIPPSDCAIFNSELLLINHVNCHPANVPPFFRPLLDHRSDPPNGRLSKFAGLC